MLLSYLPLVSLVLGALGHVSPAPATDVTTLDVAASKELLYLHRKLVEIESISDNEGDVGAWLSKYLRKQNYTVEKQTVSKGRYNLFAYPSKRDTTILLTSHIDTVPPYWPYYYNETSGVIGGRGSVDAKASAAAQIIAAQGFAGQELLRNDISLLFVVGEETGGDGMRSFSDWADRPTNDIVIFGEPTEGKLVCGHKGMVGFRLNATGKAAHSGYPWLGASANDIIVDALAALLDLRQHLPWSEKYGNTTMNFGRLVGGVAANVVAESAGASIATRVAAGTPPHVRRLIARALEPATAAAQQAGGDLHIEWGSEGYGPVDMSCDIPGFETLTVNYGTDVPNLAGDHRRFLYGPGSIFVAHSDHEALTRKELEQAVLDYRRLIIEAGKMEPMQRAEEQIEL
jgi:acetylornithine deacetylase